MTYLHIPVLRVIKVVLALILLLCLSLSPVLMQDMNALEPTDRIDIGHPTSEVIGVKNVLSQQKLLPQPVLQFLFYILPIATITRIIQLSKLLYPSIFLLRKKQILLPIKFTSIFLIRSAA